MVYALLVGGGRLAYAGLAKIGSLGARGFVSFKSLGYKGIRSVSYMTYQFRNILKKIFNAGISPKQTIWAFKKILMKKKYRNLPYIERYIEAIKSAGRTATGKENAIWRIKYSWNILGAALAGRGTYKVYSNAKTDGGDC